LAQGGVAVVARGVEVAQARGVPAGLAERVGFPHRLVEDAVDGCSISVAGAIDNV
jgi:hypothetical protein